jgi:hypothetical protein
MIYGSVELHNVAEVQPVEGGVRLQRVPESVRAQINKEAQMRVRQTCNCEIRFVAGKGPVEITLSSDGEVYMMYLQGVFDERKRAYIRREPTTLTVTDSEMVLQIDPATIKPQPFARNVHRLMFGGRKKGEIVLHGVKGDGVRPPSASELPSLRYLAYGTSITQGFDCESPGLSYAAQTAWHLGADLINLGVGGACHCDPAFADYIAERKDWDIATLELSVNMVGVKLPEFREKVAYMVNRVAGADTKRPVVCITLFPFWPDLGVVHPQWKPRAMPEEYRQVLRDVMRESPHPNVHVVDGPDLLGKWDGLGADLLHPSDNAMIEMGRNLSVKMASILGVR